MTEGIRDAHKRLLAGRARTLIERLENPDPLEHGHRDEEEVEEIFDSWREQFPSSETFEARLDELGFDESDCRRAISADRYGDRAELPDWIDRLDDLVRGVQAESHSERSRRVRETLLEEDTTQFLLPKVSAAVAAYAWEQLPEDPVRETLSEEAIQTMVKWFQVRFHRRFNRILYVEFKAFVAAHDRELAFADPDTFEDPPTEYYEQFKQYLFEDGFGDLCVEYPMFGRLLVSQLDQWVEHLCEFTRRLDADKSAIADQLTDSDAGAVSGVRPLADDTHGDGRAVMCVTFESGASVVYKPRSVTAGSEFYGLLKDLGEHLSVPDFDVPAYIERDGYGWMEWVETAECDDESAVERYYERVGSLLAVTYLLNFTDCHYENLVAAGEHPTLVDAETVLHPDIDFGRSPTDTEPRVAIEDNVFLNGLLPMEMGDGFDGQDMQSKSAGIGRSSETVQLDAIDSPKLEAINTDVVSIEQESAEFEREDNIPKLDGDDCPPSAYTDSVLSGFDETYETIRELWERGDLSAELDFPDRFLSVENRLVYRATLQYAGLLQRVRSRECLADGARFGTQLETLAVPFCDGRTTDPPWDLYEAERDALKRLDPPRFTAQADTQTLHRDGESTGVDADRSGIEWAEERLEDASDRDRRVQREYVRAALDGSLSLPESNANPPTASEPATDEDLRSAAIEIHERIEESATWTDDGTPHWAWIGPWEGGETLGVEHADESLYSGRTGIALFSAALYRLTGEERYRSFALDTLDPVRRCLRSETAAVTRSLGGAEGLGSVVYGLTTVGELTDEQSLSRDAVEAADVITEELVASDDVYDVVGGAAGTVLGLLGGYDRTGETGLLERAITCGDHLLGNRTEAATGHRVWSPKRGSEPLTGFAHGMSGIAYALCRLSEATGDANYRDAGVEALEYEDAVYVESERNWPDHREWTETEFLDQWCHGRSGIGLARLGAAEHVTVPAVTRGIDRAVEGAPDEDLRPIDHVCCGESGRIEFSLVAERRRDALDGVARQRAARLYRRARENGYYSKLSRAKTVTDPSFFHGDAGIGYTMLRVAAPETLPSVLLWE